MERDQVFTCIHKYVQPAGTHEQCDDMKLEEVIFSFRERWIEGCLLDAPLYRINKLHS